MTKSQKREVAIYLRMHNELASGIRQAELALGGFRERAHREFRRIATAVSVALIGAFTASAVSGAQFEQSLANVASVARATAEEMAALEERALALGETTAYSASQAADAMYSLASGGLNAQQIIATTEGVLKLAGATMSDMGQAAEITMSTLRQFNLEATDTERIVNVFGAGIQNSMLNMNRLADAMKYAGPVASGLNISLEETVGVLASLHNAGLLGRQAGTGLRSVLASLAAPTEELTAALQGLAVERDGLPAVIEQLRNARLSVSELTAMFGQEALPAILALTREGAAGLNAMTDAVTGTRAAWEMYQKQMDTTSGRWKLIKSAIESTLLRAFKEIKPTLNEAQDAILAWVNRSRDAIVDFVRRAVTAIRDLIDRVSDFLNFIRRNWDTFRAIGEGLAAATIAVYALATAVGVLNAVMAANSIGLVAAGLAALVAGLVFIERRFKAVSIAIIHFNEWSAKAFYFAARLGERLGLVFETAARYVAAFFIAFADTFAGAGTVIGSFATRLGQTIGLVVELLKNPFKGVDLLAPWEGYGAEVSAVFVGAWDGAFAAVKATHDARAADIETRYSAHLERIALETKRRLAELRAVTDAATQGLGWEYFLIPEPPPEAQEPFGPYLDHLQDVGRTGARSFAAIDGAVHVAAHAIGHDLVNALFDAKAVMIDLEGLGRRVFGSIIGGLIELGLGSIGSVSRFLGLADAGVAGSNALGGLAFAGNAYWVGERGERELFVPHSDGRIIPESKLGGGEVHHHYKLDVTVQVPHGSLLVADDNMAVKRLARTVGEEIDRNIRRTYKD